MRGSAQMVVSAVQLIVPGPSAPYNRVHMPVFSMDSLLQKAFYRFKMLQLAYNVVFDVISLPSRSLPTRPARKGVHAMQRIKDLLLLGFCMAMMSPGQGLTSVAGNTKDPSGAVIPGASVVLMNVDTGAERNVVSDSQGRYSFSQVQPGSYKLTAKASGFSDVTIEVHLQVNSPATVDLNFEKVGTVASSVSVSAEATQVNTTDASLGNAIGTQAITQLPFEARNVVSLLALQPGVAYLGAQDSPVLSP